jgi:hypothetical protein
MPTYVNKTTKPPGMNATEGRFGHEDLIKINYFCKSENKREKSMDKTIYCF